MTNPLPSFLVLLQAGFIALATPAIAQVPATLLQSMHGPPGVVQSDGQLGRSVAVDGAYIVVGAPLDDLGAVDSGVAKVFDSATGALLFVLSNPSPAANDQFGGSVSVSGTRVVVGALNDDTGASNAGSAYVYDLSSSTPTVPVLTLNNPGPAVGDQFGKSVAISGTRLVVSAPLNSPGAGNAGSAYVYDLSSATPTVPVLTLNDPGLASGDNFGTSVAISGTRMVVGAAFDDTGASNSGSAYAYDLSSGTPTVPVATLHNPSPEANDEFGFSVSISGTRIVVGAMGDNTGASQAGSAYVYDLSSGTPTVPVATLNNPSPAATDLFGGSVSISGTRVVVGAYLDDTGVTDAGSAYVYDLSGGTPTVPVFTLNNPSPAAGDDFGYSVAISGTRVVVVVPFDDTGATDAGSAYVYDLSSGTPTVPVTTLNNPGQVSGEWFGYSVSVSGTRMVVGAPLESTGAAGAGSVYVYDLSGATPTVPVVTLHNPSPAATDYFGISVSISGTRVVVGAAQDDTGASDAGSAYVYDLSSGTPTLPVATLNNPSPAAGDDFGYSVAISGTRVVVGALNDDTGATDAGSAYVYDLSSGTPTVPVTTLNNPSPGVTDYFGSAVAISGARVVVGANGNDSVGSAYVYDLGSATPTVPVVTLNNPAVNPEGGDDFGISVAISGTRLVVGANGNIGAGRAYVYDLGSGTPSAPVITLNKPSPAASDRFGSSVAISGTRVVVGAASEDTGSTEVGSAYVYDVSSGTPTVPVATLNNPAPAAGDGFGLSAAIDGTTVVIGTPFDDPITTDAGSAYVYGLGSGGALTISPTTIANDYTGAINLNITGLDSAEETVIVEMYLDADASNAINAGDILISQYQITDGHVTSIAGQRNLNIPGDDDGAADGRILTKLYYHPQDTVGRLDGRFIFRVSPIGAGFTPFTASLVVTQKDYGGSGISGTVTAAGVPQAGAFVLFSKTTEEGSVGLVRTDASGNFSLKVPEGIYQMTGQKSGFVFDNSSAPAVTVTAGAFTSGQNVQLIASARTISGTVRNASAPNYALPCVIVLGETPGGLFSFTFSDGSGNFVLDAPAGEWDISSEESRVARLGFLTGSAIESSAGSVTGFALFLPRATALIYGSVKTLSNTPVPFIEVSGHPNGGPDANVNVHANEDGNYTLGVTVGSWAVAKSQIPDYFVEGQDVDVNTDGSAVLQNLVAHPITAHLRGQVRDNHNNPVPNIDINVNDFSNMGRNGSADAGGYFDFGVFGGEGVSPTKEWSLGINFGNGTIPDFVSSEPSFSVQDGVDINNITYLVYVVTAHLRGQVLDENDVPITNFNINASNQNLSTHSGSVVNAGGFDIPVFGGDWYLSLDIDGQGLIAQDYSISVADNVDQNNLVFRVRHTTAATFISGSVKDTHNNPISGVQVFGNATVAGIAYLTSTMTDGGGNYSMPVFSGTWNVDLAGDDLRARGYLSPPSNQPVVVSTGTVTRDFIVQAVNAHLQGVVTKNGTPVVGIRVSAYNQSADLFVTADTVGPNGSFDLGLVAGTWSVQIEEMSAASFNIVSPSANYTLAANQTISGITIAVKTSTSQLNGWVRDSSSQPINANIFANATIGGVFYTASTQTDGGGNYVLPVIEGTWMVSAFSSDFTNPNAVTVIISGSNATRNFTLTKAPVIYNQPLDENVTAGQTFVFAISANSYSPVSFRWQVSSNGGASWSDLADGSTYGGVNSSLLNVTASIGLNGYRYRCIATNSFGSDTSSSALLTVNAAITLQSWRQQWFGSPANSGDGADLNDYDKDGIKNIVEYAFGLDPKQSSAGQLPQGLVTGGNFVISFTEPPGVTGVSYGAEWNNLLTGPWTSITDTGVPPQHTFSVPVGSNAGLFVRLKVTAP